MASKQPPVELLLHGVQPPVELLLHGVEPPAELLLHGIETAVELLLHGIETAVGLLLHGVETAVGLLLHGVQPRQELGALVAHIRAESANPRQRQPGHRNSHGKDGYQYAQQLGRYGHAPNSGTRSFWLSAARHWPCVRVMEPTPGSIAQFRARGVSR